MGNQDVAFGYEFQIDEYDEQHNTQFQFIDEAGNEVSSSISQWLYDDADEGSLIGA